MAVVGKGDEQLNESTNKERRSPHLRLSGKLKKLAMVANLEFLGGSGGLPPGKGTENIAPDTLVRLG